MTQIFLMMRISMMAGDFDIFGITLLAVFLLQIIICFKTESSKARALLIVIFGLQCLVGPAVVRFFPGTSHWTRLGVYILGLCFLADAFAGLVVGKIASKIIKKAIKRRHQYKMAKETPYELPGVQRKSSVQSFDGEEMWFEYLDGIYMQEEIVVEKLEKDIPEFCRRSAPSVIVFTLEDTKVTDKICAAIVDALTNQEKKFTKVSFAGADRRTKKALKEQLLGKGFALCFYKG